MFVTGDEIEVICQDEGFKGSLYEARIVRSMPELGSYTVEYETLTDGLDPAKKLQVTVDGVHVRPLPTPFAASCFEIGGKVDALHNDGWWIGEIVKVIEGGRRYLVRFCAEEEELELGVEQIRVHMDWTDGVWILPEELPNGDSMEFKEGTAVEISSDDEGFRGAWFSATIIGCHGKEFLVEYQHLRTYDETEPLKEIVDSLHIIPAPPDTPVVNKFKLLEEVDAFYDNAWWFGVIAKVLEGPRYVVYFKSWNEESEFGHNDLRLHHEWIDGKWKRASQELPKGGSMEFKEGTVVEISCDDEGFRGAWFSATIIGCYGKEFLVEYQLLRTDDETEPLKETVDSLHIRPAPPYTPDVDKFKLLKEVDAFYDDAWWTGVIAKVLEGPRYVVYFKYLNEESEFGHNDLRLHHEWIDGKWKRASQELSKGDSMEFKEGTAVEISSDDEGFRGAWFSATIIGCYGKEFLVEYQLLRTDDETEPSKETVDSLHIRPTPPDTPDVNKFKLLEEVDAFYDDAWWIGVIAKVLEGPRYVVYFKYLNEESEFGHNDLRLHHEWIDGKWKRASQELPKGDSMEFKEGTAVEISCDDEGDRGAWFSATIIGCYGKEFLVEYQLLRTDDETEPLKETVDSLHIRPAPPDTPDVDKFKLLKEVDAFYDDAWWTGVIAKVLEGSRYVVYFKYLNEESEFGHNDLRIHHEWIDGKWKRASQELPKGDSMEFKEGTAVEISSDDEGFRGAWFSATIIGCYGKEFLVEYQLLRTDDETEPLKETVDSLHIRPAPPDTPDVDKFKLLMEVDAFYDDAWWTGVIAKVLEGPRYVVYFKYLNEESEFGHNDLRLHHEWFDGNWKRPSQEKQTKMQEN